MVDTQPPNWDLQNSAVRNTLDGGETLERGQSLVSQNGLFRLTAQQDGNVVLYGPSADAARGPNGTAMWSSQTQGDKEGWTPPLPFSTSRNLQLRLEDDGNLALYNLVGNQPIWSSGTHVDIDPNKVTLVHPDGENEAVHEAINAAQRALQDSVDLFGRIGRTAPPPLDHDMLLRCPTNPDLTERKTGLGTNEFLRDLIEEEISIAPKVELVDDVNRSAVNRIRAEIVLLNAAMRSARPPVDSNAKDAGNYVHKSGTQKDRTRFYLTDSDTQAVLQTIGESTHRVAGWVAECQRLNKEAARVVRAITMTHSLQPPLAPPIT